MIGESGVLRIDPTTDSVCEGDKVGGVAGTGVRGGEGRKVGADIAGERGPSNAMRNAPFMGLLGGSEGSDTVDA